LFLLSLVGQPGTIVFFKISIVFLVGHLNKSFQHLVGNNGISQSQLKLSVFFLQLFKPVFLVHSLNPYLFVQKVVLAERPDPLLDRLGSLDIILLSKVGKGTAVFKFLYHMLLKTNTVPPEFTNTF